MTTIHLTLVIITGLAVLLSDEQAFLWMLGKKDVLAPRFVDVMHIVVSIGLSGIIATGGIMFLSRSTYLLHEPVFLTKMVFVGALIINGFFIDRLSITATQKPFRTLSSSERFPLLLSGAVSFSGWMGAGICGLLLAY